MISSVNKTYLYISITFLEKTVNLSDLPAGWTHQHTVGEGLSKLPTDGTFAQSAY